MKRIWRLNISLDAFNSVSAASYSDEMRSLAFQGLALGLNGGAIPSSVPESFSLAYAVGKAARDEALAHQEKSSFGGSRSVAARRERASAPSKIEPPFEPPFEPILKPKAEIRKPENRDQKTEKKTPLTTSETTATVSTQLSAVPPRAREATPAAPAWTPQQALEVRREKWSQRRQAWLKDQGVPVDFTVKPGWLQWFSYCRSVHPSWQEKSSRKAFDTLSLHNWSQGGRKIESWWQVADAWAESADHKEHFDAFMDGSFGADVSGMSAKAAGITEGEAFS